jgi:hypothetical protein
VAVAREPLSTTSKRSAMSASCNAAPALAGVDERGPRALRAQAVDPRRRPGQGADALRITAWRHAHRRVLAVLAYLRAA